MRFKRKVCHDLIGVEILLVPRWWSYNIWVTFVFIHWTSYDLYVFVHSLIQLLYTKNHVLLIRMCYDSVSSKLWLMSRVVFQLLGCTSFLTQRRN